VREHKAAALQKRLELIHELLPAVTTIGLLLNPTNAVAEIAHPQQHGSPVRGNQFAHSCICCRAEVARWNAERRRSARGIWLEATLAINAHRSDRSGGDVARSSRQPSHSNAVVRGH
jgi:hypothetical protein